MIIIDDIKKYVEKAERGTFGTIGTVGATLIGLPAASLLGLSEVVQGKDLKQATKDVSAAYGSFVDGAGQYGYDHGPAITKFLYDMIQQIGKEQARARARQSK